MPHHLHIVDAFTDKPFHGNPAAVCVLDRPADETWMKLVAREMNLSETAFITPHSGPQRANDSNAPAWDLRWFTPTVEVKLCGHATLAGAFVLWHTGKLSTHEAAMFHTLSGWLTCTQRDGMIAMDFPAKNVEPCDAPEGLVHALGAPLRWAGRNNLDYLVELDDEAAVRSLTPDHSAIAKVGLRGVIVTAPASNPRGEFDFISRFFAPGSGIAEDPVTGSAHCALAPYWSRKLGKQSLVGYQASERGGLVHVAVKGDRVELAGHAVLVSRVELMH